MNTCCPAAGAGVHSWIMAEANRCRRAGLTKAAAERSITENMTRRPSPANEVQTAVRKAYSSSSQQSPQPYLRAVPITSIPFQPEKLKAAADRITRPTNWRHWLWERSPKRPDAMNAWSFLANLYRPGEKVHVFGHMDSKRPLVTVTITQPMDCRVPRVVEEGGEGLGIWFLSNAVDGEWHDTGEIDDFGHRIYSCRNHQAVTSWRYAVLESDEAEPNLWLAYVAQLPFRIAAIYTSGGRSVHTLIRLDSASKEEWDDTIQPLKRPLKVLGADPAALSAVRLTRLPGCRRPEKGGFQKLLYLSPNPPHAPLIDLPNVTSRRETAARWGSVVMEDWS